MTKKTPYHARNLLFSTALVGVLFVSTNATAQGASSDLEDETASPEADSNEIVVTATRSSESISRVPISISALSQDQMDSRGVKTFDDIARLTPGLSFEPGRINSNVSIRGISSGAGAATTGVYIDDTPIQVRTLGVSAQNVYPTVFDLERIEVLRGPQGTLFGAGSEGGTIRFIQHGPDFGYWSAYGRGEVATTESGGASYEAGLALGGPIAEDKVGFRVSLFHRVDGGWIDKVIGIPTVIDRSGASGIGSVAFETTGVYNENTNWGRTSVARAALGFRPTDTLEITASVSYQEKFEHDRLYSFWPQISSGSDFRTPVWIPSNVESETNFVVPVEGVNGRPGAYTTEPFKDKFLLPALTAELDLGPVVLVSSTSYFDRTQSQISDYTLIHSNSYARQPVPNPGSASWSQNSNSQSNWTQEVRLQSTPDFSDRLKVIVGGFYQDSDQYNRQISYTNFIDRRDQIAVAAVPGYPTPPPAVTDGAPFGPGYSAYVNYYGVDLIDGIYHYDVILDTNDKQIAAFGQADFEVIEGLTLTLGARYAQNKNYLDPTYRGPATNLNTPQGRACVPGTGIQGGAPCEPVEIGEYEPGTGPFTPAYVDDPVQSKDTAFTPRFGVNYQVDRNNMVYATVAKGFRPGGAQQRQPSNCDNQLVALGYVDANGRPEPPTSYDSDSVWSYEFGSKNRLLNNKLSIDFSAYYIDWKNIQSTVSLASCLQSMFDNLGSASSKGFDLVIGGEPVKGLYLNATVAYSKAVFGDDVILGGRTNYTKGSALPGSGAPWIVVLSAEYERPLDDDLDGYVRSDFTYQSAFKPSGRTDPGVASYDPLISPRPETYLLNSRVGVRYEDFDVSLFVNNVLNASPSLSLTRSSGQPVFTDFTFRPRTIGLTAAYRY